jgi:hypothetical protein
MRILIQPPHLWGSPHQVMRIACKILHNFDVPSARPSAIGDQATIMIATRDLERARAVLKKAGMRAVGDWVARSDAPSHLQSVRTGRQEPAGRA